MPDGLISLTIISKGPVCACRCVYGVSPGEAGPTCPALVPAHKPVPGCTRSTWDTKVTPPPDPHNFTLSGNQFLSYIPNHKHLSLLS